MNRRHLLFVLSVAKFESFGAAANACNVTQPTLSAGVKQIEQQLGARIFQRSTRSVLLTDFGKQILPAIREVVASEDALKAQVRQLLTPETKLARIGVSPIVEVTKIVHILAAFRAQYPAVEVVFKECFVDELQDRLLSGTVDFVVWPRSVIDDNTLQSASLYSDPWVFLPNAAGANESDLDRVGVDHIAQQSLILTSGYCGLSQATQTMFDTLNLPLNLYPGRAISYSAIEEWADLGLGAAMLPASKVSRGRQGPCLPVLAPDGGAAMLDVVSSWRQDAELPQHLRALVTVFENQVGAVS